MKYSSKFTVFVSNVWDSETAIGSAGLETSMHPRYLYIMLG
jgi:hypothetical protein